MNIVKFKDTLIEGDTLFNDNFRGKYCYCVNWKWVIPISDPDYVDDSVKDSCTGEDLMILLSDYMDYLDQEKTEKINDVSKYEYLNNYIVDDITLDMLKRFRTMVAETLIACSTTWDDEYDEVNYPKISAMLEYYKNNMVDCAIKALSTFSDTATTLNGTYQDCGCGTSQSALRYQGSVYNNSNMLSSYSSACQCGNNAIMTLFQNAGCDCVSLYKKAIYNYMVAVFSDYKFWKCIPSEVLEVFIKYIDGILKAGLPLTYSSNNVSDLLYGDCSCLTNDSDSANQLILTNLKKAFQYIIDEDIVSHKNFIYETLYAWSAKLYEVMEW